MPNSSPETQQQQPAPRTHGRSLLLAADIATLVAILLIHFLSKSTSTTVALVGVVAAGLFVFIPFLIDALRPPHTVSADGAALTALQSVIRKDIRALYDGLVKHLALLEKASVDNAAAIEQVRTVAQEAASAARDAIGAAQNAATVAQEAANSAKEAAEAAPTEEDNNEIAEHLAALSVLAGEDGEVKRLVTAFQAFQQEHRDALRTATDTFRRLEESFRQSALANAPERDGPLPPSLAGKAFNATPSSAVSRIIGNAVRKAPAPNPAEARGSTPVEDDVWNVATDMANAESEPAASVESATATKTSGPSRDPQSDFAPQTQSDSENDLRTEAGDEADLEAVPQLNLVSESARRLLAATVPLPAPQSTPKPETKTAPAPDSEEPEEDEPGSVPPVPAQTDLLGVFGLQSLAPRHERPGTLIANVFTGLGGKPFVRGIGPGLSEDIGVPMEPVAIGRWQWVSPEPDRPAIVTIWKNDIHRALGAPIKVPPGQSVEASPEFP